MQKLKRKDKREKVEHMVKSQSRISIDVTFPMEKVHIPPWDATVAVTAWRRETKRKKVTPKTIFKTCTFYAGEGHIFADDIKREKKRKR